MTTLSQDISQLKSQLYNCQRAAEGKDCSAVEGDYGWTPAYACVRECNIQRAMWHKMYDGMVDKLDKAKAELKAARELVNALELVSHDD